jgi:hypothetical protein
MSDRSAHLRMLTIVGCCVLTPFGRGALADSPGQATTAPAAAVELPSLQAGLWEYRRTLTTAQSVKPQVSSIRKCADPGLDIREKKAALQIKGCEFGPVKRHDSRYTSSWTCTTTTGTVKFRDVLIVKDATHYEDLSEMHSAQQVTQQRIEAARVGDCPAGGIGAPKTPIPKALAHP